MALLPRASIVCSSAANTGDQIPLPGAGRARIRPEGRLSDWPDCTEKQDRCCQPRDRPDHYRTQRGLAWLGSNIRAK
jgi:hypothetical protein